jgi:hypothetical protein
MKQELGTHFHRHASGIHLGIELSMADAGDESRVRRANVQVNPARVVPVFLPAVREQTFLWQDDLGRLALTG